MTRTTPLRRTILQLRQILFTEANTFITASFYQDFIPLGTPRSASFSLCAEYDAPARQIVRSQLDGHLVAGEDADVMHAHLA